MELTILDGIIIGGVGGGAAGITVWLINILKDIIIEMYHKNRIYKWLYKVTIPKDTDKWRSTRTIASYNNLTEDRVRFICSVHKKIALSTGEKEDRWSINEITRNK